MIVHRTSQFVLSRSKETGNEDVVDAADSWVTSLGRSPGQREGPTTDRDYRWLGEIYQEPGSRWRSRNLLRHFRSQGRRHLPHVVLLATQEKHCVGRKQRWRQVEQARDRPWPQQIG